MSAFGFYVKDNALDALKELAEAEVNRGKSLTEVVTSLAEVFTHALRDVTAAHADKST